MIAEAATSFRMFGLLRGLQSYEVLAVNAWIHCCRCVLFMRSVRQYFDLSSYINVSGVDFISMWCQYGYAIYVCLSLQNPAYFNELHQKPGTNNSSRIRCLFYPPIQNDAGKLFDCQRLS